MRQHGEKGIKALHVANKEINVLVAPLYFSIPLTLHPKLRHLTRNKTLRTVELDQTLYKRAGEELFTLRTHDNGKCLRDHRDSMILLTQSRILTPRF